ncbi:MAG: hypothetical protein ACXVP8_08585 [Actinomycetota bacterium]
MMTIVTGHRTVLVLGRHPAVDLGAWFAAAKEAAGDLLILAVGFPLTAEQQRAVNDAVAMAVDTGVWLEARIAYRARDVSSFVHRDDRVHVFAAGKEERTIGRALRRAGLSPGARGGVAAR